jgi:hypothetical protein
MNVNGLLGSPEPTLGSDDHRRSRKHDRGAEDQEPHRVGTWYDIVRELID